MDETTLRAETVPPADTITISRSRFFTFLVPLAFILGLGVGYLVWGRAPQTPNPAPQAAAAQAKIKRYDVPVDNNPAIGPDNAAITIIEFSDYECPYCKQWQDQVLPLLRQAYPDKVRVVYRDLPIQSLHPDAFPAAEAARCAGDQGKYWQMHDKLFSMEYGLNADAYQKYAGDLGLDMNAFERCLSERKFKDVVQANLDYASNLGVRSTPTFFLNGIPLVGAQPFDVFQQIIDKELASEIPK